MSQTVLNKNEFFYAVNGEPIRIKKETITGAADLVAGTVIIPDGAGKFKAALDADKVVSGAAAVDAGWRILLEDAAVSGGDVIAKTGKTGGIDEADVVGATGLTVDDLVYDKLQMNSVYVQKRTNSIRVAGEGA